MSVRTWTSLARSGLVAAAHALTSWGHEITVRPASPATRMALRSSVATGLGRRWQWRRLPANAARSRPGRRSNRSPPRRRPPRRGSTGAAGATRPVDGTRPHRLGGGPPIADGDGAAYLPAGYPY